MALAHLAGGRRRRAAVAAAAVALLGAGGFLLASNPGGQHTPAAPPTATGGPLTAVHHVVTFTLTRPDGRLAQDTLAAGGLGQPLLLTNPPGIHTSGDRTFSLLASPAPDAATASRAADLLRRSGGAADVTVTPTVLACADYALPKKAKHLRVGVTPWQVTAPAPLTRRLDRVTKAGGWSLTAVPGRTWLLRVCLHPGNDQTGAVAALEDLAADVADATSLPAGDVHAAPVGGPR